MKIPDGKDMYESFKADGRMIFYALRGSRLYGTFIDTSDYDYHGVFMYRPIDWVSLTPPDDSMEDAKGDVVFYELRKYVGMALNANPTVIEMMWTPDDAIVYSTDVIREFFKHRSLFVTKKCFYSFSGYAFDQIEKARGKNKKVHSAKKLFSESGIKKLRQLIESDKISSEWVESRFSKDFLSFLEKGVGRRLTKNVDWKEMDNYLQEEDVASLCPPKRSDFVYVIPNGQTEAMPARPVSLKNLPSVDLDRMNCSSVEHIGHLFRIYEYGDSASGIFKGGKVVCSSIPIDDEYSKFFGLMIVANTEYESEKKEWSSYWEWMAKRNESRWEAEDTKQVFDYDKKNMQHTHRLIMSAEMVARDGCPCIRFQDDKLAFLRKVRAGDYSYDYLLGLAEQKLEELRVLFDKSGLPDSVRTADVNDLYVHLVSMGSK
jgi:predicted nucleotidyltransferase